MRLAAFFAVVGAICFGADSGDLYRQAVDRQRGGDLAGAVQLYQECLKQDPANVLARSNLGVALVGLGRYDEAIPEYELALRDAPEAVRSALQRNIALAYYKAGRIADAIQMFLNLHSAMPANRDYLLLAADCYLMLGEPEQAVELMQAAAADASTDKAFAYMYGMALLKAGKTAEAQRILDPILKDTSSAEGNFAMGAAMFTAKDFPGAVKAFARAIEINPALPRLYSYYGQALLVTGDPEGASDAFRKQLSTDPNDYESNLQLAEILIHRRAFSEAEPLLRRAVLVRGQSAEARYALASNFQAEGKTDEARREFETIVKQWPEFGAAHARLAEVYERAGLPAEAAREKALAAKFGIPKTQPEPVGLQPGTPAPAFELARSGGKGRVSVPSPQPGRPTVLVFGSYSCPNFRGAAPVLNRLAAEYGNRSAFLLVYIREAHATGQWQSSINQRENVTLAPAATAEQKQEYATMCSRKLHLSFPAVVDGMDGATEKAYAAWPSRAYVIGADGRVRYATALDEQDFDPKALEAAIRQSIAGSK